MVNEKDDGKKKKKKQSALDILKSRVSDKSAAGILRDRQKEIERRIREAGG